jgi:hypothetical protein
MCVAAFASYKTGGAGVLHKITVAASIYALLTWLVYFAQMANVYLGFDNVIQDMHSRGLEKRSIWEHSTWVSSIDDKTISGNLVGGD